MDELLDEPIFCRLLKNLSLYNISIHHSYLASGTYWLFTHPHLMHKSLIRTSKFLQGEVRFIERRDGGWP